MEKRAFGKTGLLVSALGVGAAEMGHNLEGVALAQAILDEALAAGVNLVDTAECYAASEQMLGAALQGRRDEVVLATKCGHSRGYGDPDWERPQDLEKSLETSLERLKTDRVDLFQLHSCPLHILEKGTVIDVVHKAKRAGKTRFIGYSGDSQAALYAVRTGVFDALQISVSIADQEAVDLVLPEAVKRGMAVIAKRPIANAAWVHAERPIEYHAPYWERLGVLDYPFLRAKDAAERALRFTLSVPGVSCAITGTQRRGRMKDNARAAAKGHLPKAEYERIRERWRERAKPDWVGQT